VWFFANEYLGNGNRALTNSAQIEHKALVLTEEPQDAVFYIGPGWTGGMGSAPVLDASGDRPQQYNGNPIFFDESKVDEVLKRGKMPACVTGQAEVKVEANITLSPKTGKNYSIPPDSNGRPTEQHYYEATLNRLDNVVITYEPCQD